MEAAGTLAFDLLNREQQMNRATGFTLIELMVVVAIVGILASVGVPIYSGYVIRGKLVEAPGTMADLRVRIEQYYQDNRTYVDTATAGRIGNCGLITPIGTTYFVYSCVASDGPPQTYTITATSAVGTGIGAAGDYTYNIKQDNTRQTTKFQGAVSTAVCWLLKPGNVC